MRRSVRCSVVMTVVFFAWIFTVGGVHAGVEIEPNGSIKTATAVAADSDTTLTLDPAGDEDWLAISVPSAGRLVATAPAPPATVRVGLTFYGRHTQWLGIYTSAVNDGDDVSLALDIAEPGTWYLRVRDEDGEASATPFTLSLSFTPAVDAYEPNDQIGHAALMPSAAVQGRIFPAGESDWFRIYAAAGGTLSVTVTPPAGMRPRVAIYGPSFEWLGVYTEAVHAGDEINLTYPVPTAGVYSIRVQGYDGGSHTDAYTLTVGGGTPGYEPPRVPVTIESESNDALGEANAVTIGASVSGAITPGGDLDWYRIDPAGAGQLAFSCDQAPAGLTLRARLYDCSGNQVLSAQAGEPGGLFGFTRDITTGDPLYLRFEDVHGASSASSYTFSLSLTQVTDPYEPNNGFGDAAALAAANQVQGWIFPGGDYDWYRVTAPAAGDLRVHVGDLPANIQPVVAVYSASGGSIGSVTGTAGTDLELVQPIPEPGDWYLLVRSAGGGDVALDPYTLTVFGADFAAYAPVAEIESIDPGAIVVGDSIEFTGAGYDADGTVVQYDWASDIDGTIGTQAVFTATTLSVGTHTVRFRVRDNDGYWSTPVEALVYVGSSVTEEAEPNGSFRLADEIAFDVSARARIDPAGDYDYFKVYVDGPSRVELDLTNVPTNLRLEVALYNRRWEWLGVYTTAASDGDDVSIALHVTEPGFVYARIRDVNGDSEPAFTYTLTATRTAVPDPYEPNNSLLDAWELTTPTIDGYTFPNGDEDWFKIWIDAGSPFVAEVSGVPANLRMQVAIWGRNREWLGIYESAVNQGDDVSISHTPAEAGYYYVRVRDDDADTNWDETWRLTVTGANPGFVPVEPPMPVEQEPNDTIADATPVSTGTLVAGAIGSAGDPDWYKFTVPAPGVISVLLDQLPPELRGRVRVFRTDGTQLGYREASNPGDDVMLDVRVTRPDVYQVLVDAPNGAASADPYRLIVDFVTVDDPNEPNDCFHDAVPLSTHNRAQGFIFDVGDSDWYRVHVPAGQTLVVTVADVPAELRPEIGIYNHDGVGVASRAASNDGEELVLSYAVPEEADYTVRIGDSGSNNFSVDAYTVLFQGAVFDSYAPRAEITSIAPSPAITGDPVTLEGHGEDPDGTIIAYEWESSIDGTFSSSRVVPGITTLGDGVHTIRFRVKDNDQNWSPWTSTLLYVGPTTPGEVEPNDVAGSATPLTLDLPFVGTIDPAGEYDWYVVCLPGPGRLVVETTNPSGSEAMRTEIAMYGREIQWMGICPGASNPGDPVTMTWDLGEGGCYYARIRDLNNGSGNSYTVTASFQQSGDPYEPNPDAANATPLAADGAVDGWIFPAGEEDWYAVDLPSAGTLDMSLTDMPADLRGGLAVYNGSVGWTGVYRDANNAGDDVLLGYNASEGGRCYVRVRGHDSGRNPSESYRLTTVFTPADDVHEPNGGVGSATLVTATPVDAFIFPNGDYDWYRFYAEPGSNVEITASDLPPNLRLQLDLYNSSFGWTGVGASAPEGDDVVLGFPGATGYYYLRIYERDGDYAAGDSYRLQITGTPLAPLPPEVPVTSETEPNGGLGYANLVEPGSVSGVIDPSGDDEWFRLDLSDAGQLDLSFAAHPALRPVVRVYNADGGEYASRTAENRGDASQLTLFLPTGGTWYVRVYDADGAASMDPYTLGISFTASGDAFEPNPRYEDAVPIDYGVPVHATILAAGDRDWYRVEVDEPGIVGFDLSEVPDDIEIGLYVYDANATQRLGVVNLNGGDPLSRSLLVSDPGTLRFQVLDRADNDASTDPYRLLVSFTAVADPAEPNDRLSDATPLAAENRAVGVIYPVGDVDWYRFDVDMPGTIRVQLAESEGIQPRIRLFNDSGGQVASVTAHNDGQTVELSYVVPEADTLYALVDDHDANGTTSGSYVLTVGGGVFDTHAPIASIDRVAPNPATPADTVGFSGTATDADGVIVAYEWTSDRDGLLGVGPELALAGLSVGEHLVSFRAQDHEGHWSASARTTLQIADPLLSEAEYNNDWASAVPLPLDTWVTGRIEPAGDPDFYRVLIPGCGMLTARVDGTPPWMRPGITVYGENGEWLGIDIYAWNDGEYLEVPLYLNPGYYNVRVRDADNQAGDGAYGLRCAFAPGVDRYESNANAASATAIDPDSVVDDATICPPGDEDWYRIPIPGVGRFEFSLTDLPSAMRGEIALYDANVAWLGVYLGGYYAGDDVAFHWDAAAAGAVYVRIRDLNGAAHAEPYTFTSAFTPGTDTHEPNNHAGQATPVATSVTDASIFAGGDEDWYRIWVGSNETVQVTLDPVPADMRGRIALYDGNVGWMNVYQDANNPGDRVVLSYTSPAERTYFVQIRELDGRSLTEPYRMTITGALLGHEPPFAPSTTENEPNPDSVSATDIALATDVSGTVDPVNDHDWFRFRVPTPGIVEIAHTDVPVDILSEFWVYNEARGQVGYRRTTNPGEDNLLILHLVETGDYFVLLHDQGNNNSSTSPYTLRVTHTPVVDPNEPNNGVGTATTPTGSTADGWIFAAGDLDFYRFYARQSGAVTVSLDDVPADLRPRLRLYDRYLSERGTWVGTNPGDAGADLITWTAPEAGFFYVRVNDENGGVSTASYTVRVTGADFSSAPELAAVGDRVFDESLAGTIVIHATDPDTAGTDLVYSASNLPTGALFDPATRTLSWTPAPGQDGDYPGVRFAVTDGVYEDSELITLTVRALDTPPVLDPVGDRSALAGLPIAFTVSGHDPDLGDSVTFAAAGLPAGAAFDPGTRAFSWTPAMHQGGVHGGIRFEITDGTWTDFEIIEIEVLVPSQSYDAWKAEQFTPEELADPLVSGDDADADGDGATTIEEYHADTDPMDPGSVLAFTSVVDSSGGVAVQWKGGVNARQVVRRAPFLDTPAAEWVVVDTREAPTTVTGDAVDGAASEARAVYRIEVERR